MPKNGLPEAECDPIAVHQGGRAVGPSGLVLPPYGFGGSGLGNLYDSLPDDVALDTIQVALDGGFDYFDTAPHYGFGLSERRLGRVLPRSVKISSKVGRLLRPLSGVDPAVERHGFVAAEPFEPYFDYSYDGVMRSFEASLRRLRRDRIEILLVHDLGKDTHGEHHLMRFREFFDGGYKAMQSLRDDGVIDAIGMGVNEWQVCDAALDQADFDLFFLAGRYTLLEQAAAERFLPRCSSRGASVIAGAPFNSGILVTGAIETARYNYGHVPHEVVKRLKLLQDVCRAHETPIAAAALQFPLAHPQVACVVSGYCHPDQVRQTLAWSRHPIPDALWHDLRSQGLLHPNSIVPGDDDATFPGGVAK